MKFYLGLTICLLCSTLLSAQELQDVVYLKNGSILRGKVIEVQSDSIVKIEFEDDNIWVFKTNEIEKITQEKPLHNRKRVVENKTGYNLIIDMGQYIGLKKEAEDYVNFGMIHSYSFIPNLSTGLGINLDLGETVYIPVFFDVKYYINRKYIAPIITFSFGHAFPKEEDISIQNRNLTNQGGLYFATGLGLEFPQNENLSLLISFAYKYQKNTYKSKEGDSFYEMMDKNSRFALKIGLLFH